MREFERQGGPTCVLDAAGIHAGPQALAVPPAPRPEIVAYVLRGSAGWCALSGDWATHGIDDVRTLVESAARAALGGAASPFDGASRPLIAPRLV